MQFLPLIGLVVLFYFLMIRPQMKRQKEHRAMLDKLSRGDEVITNGGIADLANGSASTMAGSVTAALFLERFVAEGQPWGHVDVYAWNDSDRPGKPAGGEAQGLRAAYALLKSRTT